MELAIRAMLSGLLVATIALIARKSPGLGGLIASIPLVSTLGMIWLWRDSGDPKLVADYVYSAFWYFLPSIPMFLLIPWMLRSGFGFWPALSAGIALTFILYMLTIGIAARFGVRL
ncbi:MAG: DUF3147 family protein [Sphingorhabdus sp.]